MMSNSILDVNCLRASPMWVQARYSTRMLWYDSSNASSSLCILYTWWLSPGAGGGSSCVEPSWCQPTAPQSPWCCWCPATACKSCPSHWGRQTPPWTHFWCCYCCFGPVVCCCDFWWSPGHSYCHREDSVWWANSWKSKHLNDHFNMLAILSVWSDLLYSLWGGQSLNQSAWPQLLTSPSPWVSLYRGSPGWVCSENTPSQ